VAICSTYNLLLLSLVVLVGKKQLELFFVLGCCSMGQNITVEISLTDDWQGEEITVIITPK
jgi:hypothetical protein